MGGDEEYEAFLLEPREYALLPFMLKTSKTSSASNLINLP